MPYTKKKDRERYEPALKDLREKLAEEIGEERATKGDLTYILYALGIEYFTGRKSYTTMSDAISCLIDAAEEIRRTHLNPYEDLRREENGDVE